MSSVCSGRFSLGDNDECDSRRPARKHGASGLIAGRPRCGHVVHQQHVRTFDRHCRSQSKSTVDIFYTFGAREVYLWRRMADADQIVSERDIEASAQTATKDPGVIVPTHQAPPPVHRDRDHDVGRVGFRFGADGFAQQLNQTPQHVLLMAVLQLTNDAA